MKPIDVQEAKRTMNGNATHRRRRGEAGFALVLAILALMLLTFLGLTLAATSSTELQIATNYRWSQQALYNAEAGLEAAKVVLSRLGGTGTWDDTLPPVRPGPWSLGTAPDPGTGTGRDYYQKGCSGDRAGVGYGLVLAEGGQRYEDVSTFMAQQLHGGFTLWVRRDVVVNNDGTFADEADPLLVVVTAEGVAPYSAEGGGAQAFTRANQAVRTLELKYNLVVQNTATPCVSMGGQAGLGPTGENFNPCALIEAGAGGTLEGAFGAAGQGETGTLDAAPNVQ